MVNQMKDRDTLVDNAMPQLLAILKLIKMLDLMGARKVQASTFAMCENFPATEASLFDTLHRRFQPDSYSLLVLCQELC